MKNKKAIKTGLTKPQYRKIEKALADRIMDKSLDDETYFDILGIYIPAKSKKDKK